MDKASWLAFHQLVKKTEKNPQLLFYVIFKYTHVIWFITLKVKNKERKDNKK